MSESAKPLSADLVGKIRIEILTERLRPDEKLTEQTLCDKYNVSRTPIREALKNLEAEGLVQMIPNKGAFVVGLKPGEIRDLFILRMQCEMQAVRWAIERRTSDEMEAIEESLDFMRFYTERGDVKRMRPINAKYHRNIADASHNRILIDYLTKIQDYLRYSSLVIPCRADDLPVLLKEHIAIYSGFKKNDPEAGALAMEKHIKNSMMRAIS